ncbi:MAG: phosphoribosylanthranilate isomerase [bacterium]
MTRVKICGITTVEDASAAVGCGADALGFVFAESPRRIAPEEAREIIERLPPFFTAVGVFVDEPAERVREIARLCRLDALQFHGRESPQYCRGFDRRVIKAFKVRDGSIAAEMAGYDVDAYLLDSWAGGGTGQRFNWNLVRGIKGRIILAGGLTPENVGEAITKLRPYAVDVSTGVERSPGKKDHYKIEEFVRNVRRCDRQD